LTFVADKLLKQGIPLQKVLETLEVNEEWLKDSKKRLNLDQTS
jgi:hypothetical protein